MSILQNSYCLEIRDGHQRFDFPVEDMRDIFVRPRISTLIGDLREFQYKLLQGAVYTKEQLLKCGFRMTCVPFVIKAQKHIRTYFGIAQKLNPYGRTQWIIFS